MKGDVREVAFFDLSVEDVADLVQGKLERDADDLDDFDVVWISAGGFDAAFQSYVGQPQIGSALLSDVDAPAQLLDAVFDRWPALRPYLSKQKAVDWVRARRAASGTRSLAWQLRRQDDHGNRYLVGAFATEQEARAAAERLEAKGHKQLYEVGKAEPLVVR